MWRPKLPQRNSDALLAVGLMVVLPAVLMIAHGAPIVGTVLATLAIGGALLLIYS